MPCALACSPRRVPWCGPVAVGRDVPIAPPRHRRGARLGIPRPFAAPLRRDPVAMRPRSFPPPLRPRIIPAHYPGGAMGRPSGLPTRALPAITPRFLARALAPIPSPLLVAWSRRRAIARGGSPPLALAAVPLPYAPPARLPPHQGLRKVTHRIRCVSFCKLRRIFRKDLGYCEDLLFFLSWQS